MPRHCLIKNPVLADKTLIRQQFDFEKLNWMLSTGIANLFQFLKLGKILIFWGVCWSKKNILLENNQLGRWADILWIVCWGGENTRRIFKNQARFPSFCALIGAYDMWLRLLIHSISDMREGKLRVCCSLQEMCRGQMSKEAGKVPHLAYKIFKFATPYAIWFVEMSSFLSLTILIPLNESTEWGWMMEILAECALEY